MSTVAPTPDPESDPRVKTVFDDIRATRQTDFINNLWRRLAFDPPLLEATWAEVKRVMATPSAIDPLTKEMVYITASIINGCGYCVAACPFEVNVKPELTALAAKCIACGLCVKVCPMDVLAVAEGKAQS